MQSRRREQRSPAQHVEHLSQYATPTSPAEREERNDSMRGRGGGSRLTLARLRPVCQWHAAPRHRYSWNFQRRASSSAQSSALGSSTTSSSSSLDFPPVDATPFACAPRQRRQQHSQTHRTTAERPQVGYAARQSRWGAAGRAPRPGPLLGSKKEMHFPQHRPFPVPRTVPGLARAGPTSGA